jgi:hypothetical protein
MLGPGVGSIGPVSSLEQTEAGTPKHTRRTLVLIAALAARTAVDAAATSLMRTHQ